MGTFLPIPQCHLLILLIFWSFQYQENKQKTSSGSSLFYFAPLLTNENILLPFSNLTPLQTHSLASFMSVIRKRMVGETKGKLTDDVRKKK